MAGGVLGIGVNGLKAYQLSLQAVSHNITNANSEGYSRQHVDLGTQTPLFRGGSYIGSGVKVLGIERLHDGFLTGQVRSYTSSFNEAESYSLYAGQVDEIMADPDIGLMPALDGFFSAVHAVANDPVSTPARQSMLSQGEAMVDRFQYLDQRFREMRSQLNLNMDNVVSEINTLTEQIAELNRNIVLAPGLNPPNDLLDQRDVLLNKLSERVSITTLEQDNGAIDVFIGRGQILVLNFDAQNLVVSRNQYDISQKEVSIDQGGNFLEISNFVTGGELGGIFNFRENVLNPAQNSLGTLAMGLAETFNTQQRLGQDLNGVMGIDFFTEPPIEVLPGTGAPGTIAANIVDPGQLKSDEYLLSYSGGDVYVLENLSTGAATTINTGGTYPYTSADMDGFNLTIQSGAATGDSYLIRPGRLGSIGLEMSITDPRQVAAASPVRSSKALANTGSGEISPGTVTGVVSSPTGAGLGGDITVTYNAGNLQISGATVTGSPLSVPYSAGQTISLALSGGDITTLEFDIGGVPNDGDVFVIQDNIGGGGDNRNALNLAGLQTARLLNNSNSSYNEFYGDLVADIGIKTNQAETTEKAQSRLLEQATNARDALSGVNLDEEAAALMKFQQAYQAASQIIVASNNMFQNLIVALRGG